MIISHTPVFLLSEADVNDWFMYRLRKPDQLRMRWDDDGHRGERNLDALVQTRRKNGLPEVAILNAMREENHSGDTPRKFIPAMSQSGRAAVVSADQGPALFREGCRYLEDEDRRGPQVSRAYYIWARYRVEDQDVLYFMNAVDTESDRRVFIHLDLERTKVPNPGDLIARAKKSRLHRIISHINVP